MTTILKAEKLNKIFEMGENVHQHVLKDIDLCLHRGEFLAVMGASGSGKSTLLYNISGMDKMSSGRVEFLGRNLASMSEAARAKLRLTEMGFIFQQPNLLKNFNILDNIILPAYQAGQEKREAINSWAAQLLEQTGIAELADNDITQASGGQLQRAAICRALINKPQIVFGDEPTGALNSSATADVMNILTRINASGATIMLVTHDPKVAARAGRVLYMIDGRITAERELGALTPATDVRARENSLLEWLQAQGF